MKEVDAVSRNKYPEETVQKILEVSYQLFTQQGYEKTSIQDIVDKIGMSKGAIYHHFKSKEEILNRLCEGIYEGADIFTEVKNIPGITALEKLSRLFLYELQNEKKVALDAVTAPVYRYNARMILESLQCAVEEIAPEIACLIEEGNRDGSIHTQYPREASETLLVLMNIWINPAIFPVEKERFIDKVRFYQQVLDRIGIPLIDSYFLQVASDYYDAVNRHEWIQENENKEEIE